MRALIIIALTFTIAAPAIAQDFPKLEDDATSSECREALALAASVYRSNASNLYEPAELPSGVASTYVLRRVERDISGGDGLVHDNDEFERIELDHGGVLHWQRRTQNGVRVAVRSRMYGWRGAMYDYHLLAETTRLDDYMEHIAPLRNPPGALVADAWQPGPVLRNANGELWIIGTETGFFAPWQVYLARPDREPICTIRFRPDVPHGRDMLPEAVREFARLLDASLGQPHNEGTLASTTRLRGSMYTVWANVALRPWAELRIAMNSRAEVDHALSRWARRDPVYRGIHDAMMAGYAPAEAALTEYYEERFALAPTQAYASARYLLDAAFRANYTFHCEHLNRHGAGPNPWPSDVH